MAKVLKITKADKTVHVVPIANKPFYQSYINRLPEGQKWKLEEIDERDAENLPFIDESHVTGDQAVAKSKELEETIAAKDAEIAALREQLGKQSAPRATAEEVIALVNAATTVEQVKTLVEGDERKTVITAAEKKIASLEAA